MKGREAIGVTLLLVLAQTAACGRNYDYPRAVPRLGSVYVDPPLRAQLLEAWGEALEQGQASLRAAEEAACPSREVHEPMPAKEVILTPEGEGQVPNEGGPRWNCGELPQSGL